MQLIETQYSQERSRLAWALFSLTLLSACGGESGPDNPQVVELTPLLEASQNTSLPNGYGIKPGTPPLAQSAIRDTEYLNNNASLQANLDKALMWRIKGAGVKIALIDTGLNPNHQEFAGRVDIKNSGSSSNGINFEELLYDADGHGSAVAGIALAADDGVGMQGVAPLATLQSIRASGPSGNFTSDAIANAIEMARLGDSHIVNISSADTSSSRDLTYDEAVFKGVLSASEIRAFRGGVDADMLFTLAAGNQGARQPNWPGKMAAYAPAKGQMLVVGALNNDGTAMANYSNMAGAAQNYYILAPGSSLLTPKASSNDQYQRMSGTSFAAPFVAGAAALVKSAGPPTLTSKDIIAILLSTTDDMGAPGTDPIFGAGALNIERALSPIGARRVPTSLSPSGPSVPLSTVRVGSRGLLGSTLGTLGEKRVLFLDQYNREYFTTLGEAEAPANSVAANWLQTQEQERRQKVAHNLEMGLAYQESRSLNSSKRPVSDDSFRINLNWRSDQGNTINVSAGNHWAKDLASNRDTGVFQELATNLYGDGYGLSLGQLLGDKTQVRVGFGIEEPWTSALGQEASLSNAKLGFASLDRIFNDQTKVFVQLGLAQEQEQILGTQVGAAFTGQEDVESRFAQIGAEHEISRGLTLGLAYSFGETQGLEEKPSERLIKNFEGVKLESAAIWLSYAGKGKSFDLSLKRKLGFRKGKLVMALPTKVAYDDQGEGTVNMETLSFNLGSLPLYEVRADYSMAINALSEVSLFGQLRLDENSKNITAIDDDLELGLLFKTRF